MSIEEMTNAEANREPYFGSVLFFKHIIFITVILLIVIPTVFAVYWGIQNKAIRDDLATIKAELNAAHQDQALAAQMLASDNSGLKHNEFIPAQTPSYTELYPDLYAPEVKFGSENIDKSVYLTFDDGPSPRTDEILQILDKYDIKATFFVIGSSDETGLERLRAIAAAGHTIGIHSYSHNYNKIYASVEDYLADFNKMYCEVVEATGVAPCVFRFPGGSLNAYNGNVYKEIIAEMTRRGFVYFDWNASSGDAASSKLQSADAIASNSLKGLGMSRVILLMHDSAVKTTTVKALPAVIEGYRNAGFTFHPITAETLSVNFGYRK